ncbi:MAG TPA: transglutaminase domain-containing protein [Mogibacterium sp.]|nr:transglutaminase domain-containing protein [Mogibacterium sp.]
MKRNLCIVRLIFVTILFFAFSCTVGCTKVKEAEVADNEGASRDTKSVVLVPRADGTQIFEGTASLIDASHLEDGYVMVKYTGDGRIKMQLSHNDQEPYTYDLPTSGVFQTFPLSCGDGYYTLNIYRQISGDQYAFVDGTSFNVSLKNEFTPFLHPNQYVDYTEKTEAVAFSEKLAKGASDDLDVVKRIYDYVVNHVVYDTKKAENVSSSYLPDLDDTLKTKKGICFDYAALMTAMLRVQRIPTQLVIGYAGKDYHAWISVYTEETGWINGIIQFDGKDWVLMDPTFAAGHGLAEYIGDGSNYNAMFYY